MRGRLKIAGGVLVAALLMFEVPVVIFLLLGGTFDEGIRALIAWNVFFACIAAVFGVIFVETT